MPCARSATTARAGSHWPTSSLICGAGGRAWRSTPIASVAAFAIRRRSLSA